MNITETFIRSTEWAREACYLPATSYNLAKILLARSQQKALFVPICNMQYLAVLDQEEFIFVDTKGIQHLIQLAWQSFRPQDRISLEQPVAYQAVYYSPEAKALMRLLERGLFQSLRQLQEKRVSTVSGKVIFLRR